MPAPLTANGGDLTRLIEAERRLHALLAETRRTAEFVEGARKKAWPAHKSDKEIAEATARLRQAVERDPA